MKKTVAFLLLIFMLCAFAPNASALEVSAYSAVLIEAESGKIIFAKDENTRRGMASTTKIMTAIVAIENMPLDTIITVPREAVGVEGSSIYLTEGEKITLEDLIYALMLQSANDAAAAIAIAVGGSIEGFADMMNAKCDSLGLSDTHFENPHGLDGQTHYTTAYELALLSAYALKNEDFARIVSTKTKTIETQDGTGARVLVNHNRLLRTYDDVIGVKTGFTKRCGRTLVSAAERGGVRLVAVTLNDGNDWQDHRAMLDLGFELYENVSIAKKGEFSFDIHVVGGESETVSVANKESLCLVLPKERTDITVKTELERFIYAGLPAGSRAGRVRFFLDGKEIGALTLYTAEDIPKKTVKRGFFGK